MGSLEMRNLLLSKKLKLSETRLLIIDDNQIRYNEILNIFQSKNHPVHAILLDDLSSFEKQLHTRWDLVIFGQAYDLKLEQAITLIHASSQIDIPVLLLKPQDYKPEHYQTLILLTLNVFISVLYVHYHIAEHYKHKKTYSAI